MLQIHVDQPDSFSRIQLILRTFFGAFYIIIPHFFVLLFVMIWAKILWLYVTFYILFTGQYPKKVWGFNLGLLHWLSRLHLSVYNLSDQYPGFGVHTNSEMLKIEIAYNETPNRLWVLLRFMFSALLLFPHIIIWSIRNIMSGVLAFLAFWVVLFTGKYPKSWFDFNIGTLRWIMRIIGYQIYMFDEYPPFNGKE